MQQIQLQMIAACGERAELTRYVFSLVMHAIML
jgi:hypothetical protein